MNRTRDMKDEIPHAYSDKELEYHLTARPLKNCLERMHAHNLDLADLANTTTLYLLGEGPNPAVRIEKYVNPKAFTLTNDADRYLTALVTIMSDTYVEGSCPDVPIVRYCHNSCLTVIDRLGVLHPATHLTIAEERISKIFYFLRYRGEPTMTPEEYKATLLKLKDEFLEACAANARELEIFMAGARARIEDTPAARVYRKTCHELQIEARLTPPKEDEKRTTPNIAKNDRGPKNTPFMKQQREAVRLYVEVECHRPIDSTTTADCVHVWNLSENKDEWDSRATRTDTRRGYSDPHALKNAVIHFFAVKPKRKKR